MAIVEAPSATKGVATSRPASIASRGIAISASPKPKAERVNVDTRMTTRTGNTGSEDQLSYALIGNTVNLASRLEGLNKEFGTEIIISGASRLRLNDNYPLKKLPVSIGPLRRP